DWSAPWIRAALMRASVEPAGEGWIVRGGLSLDDFLAAPGGDPAQGRPPERYRFTVELTSKGAPSRCTLRREEDSQDLVSIAYGPERRFEGGRFPRWVEWSYSGSVAKLTVEELSPVGRGRIRYPTSTDPKWTIWTLDEPQGKEFTRWLLGLPKEGTE
ncbi:MAG: hypothetical protein HY568_01735, partial [Candidatus Latescibacteria bacterium]|nr:hypothetical protein [Candidatus Latescibacterota bacterium]